MKLTKTQLKQMIQEAASEYVWGVKNPGRVANKYKISALKQIIKEELEVILTNEEAGELFGEEVEELLNEKEIEEKKQPSEASMKKAHVSLEKTAKKKFPKDKERQDKYIYGGKRKIGWTPAQERK